MYKNIEDIKYFRILALQNLVKPKDKNEQKYNGELDQENNFKIIN